MIQIILLLAIFLNIFLGVFVLTQNHKTLNNQVFSLLSFFAAIWTFTNYMTSMYASMLWLESTYALGSLVISTGLIWTLVISESHINNVKIYLISLIAIFFSVSSFLPGFIAKSYDQIYIGAVFIGGAGWGLSIYSLFYMIVSFSILYNLYNYKKNTGDAEKKSQFKLIFIGALITLTITAFSSFILPHFSIFLFSGIDNIGFLFFLIFITYSISKHHLFNIKVIAVELVTFGLWIFMIMRIILAKNLHDVLVESGLFIIVVILGILLIQSVLQGIRQRKEIKDLTSNLEKAYSNLENRTVSDIITGRNR